MKFKIGDKVKILDVGNMHSNDPDLAEKLNATTWEPRKPFNRTLEGKSAIIKNIEKGARASRYLIEIENGDQYIISKRGLEKIDNFLTDDLFEI